MPVLAPTVSASGRRRVAPSYFHVAPDGAREPYSAEDNVRIASAQAKRKPSCRIANVVLPNGKIMEFEVRFGTNAISDRCPKPPESRMIQVNLETQNTRAVVRSEPAPDAAAPLPVVPEGIPQSRQSAAVLAPKVQLSACSTSCDGVAATAVTSVLFCPAPPEVINAAAAASAVGNAAAAGSLGDTQQQCPPAGLLYAGTVDGTLLAYSVSELAAAVPPPPPLRRCINAHRAAVRGLALFAATPSADAPMPRRCALISYRRFLLILALLDLKKVFSCMSPPHPYTYIR